MGRNQRFGDAAVYQRYGYGGEWTSGTIQWSNKPAANVLLQSNISHNNVTGYTINCLTAVQHWYTGDTTGQNENYGIMLRYYDETTDDYNAVYSADYSVESKRPKLVISYETAGVISDGVYYIKNSNSGLYLATSGGVAENTLVHLSAQAISGLSQVQQLWKVTYLGSGYYSIRPLHKLDMGLHVTSNNVNITTTAGAGDSLTDVASQNRWGITATSNGKYYVNYMADTDMGMTYPSGMISPGMSVVTAENTGLTKFEWEFVALNDATSGLVMYDMYTSAAVVNPMRYITEGETCTLAEYKLQPMSYSEDGLQIENLQWTYAGADVNVSSTTGSVTGWEYSTNSTVITGANEYGSVQFTVSYLIIREGVHFIQNAGNSQCAGYDSEFIGAGTLVSAQAFNADNGQRWNLDHLGDGTFRISTANTSPVYYLSVQGNSTEIGTRIILQSGTEETALRWRIEDTTSGAHKLIPLSGESNGLVLAPGSSVLEQRAYTDDIDFLDEWFIPKIEYTSSVEVEAQQKTNWCWVTSARMFAKHFYPDVSYTQAQAVTHVKGSEIDDGGNRAEAQKAINYYVSNISNAHIDTKYYDEKIYSEETLKRFLDDGFVVYVSRGWYVNINNVYSRNGGHATLIFGYAVQGEELRFLVRDPGPVNKGESYLISYEKLCNGRNNQFGENPDIGVWYASLVVNTVYDHETIPYYFDQ